MSAVINSEVTAALAAFPGVAAVTVTERSADVAGRCQVAYVEASERDLDVPALHAHLRRRLPGHLVPAAIVVLDAMPISAGGGIDMQALPVPDLSSLMPYRSARTSRQKILCEIFAEVLGIPRCGLDDDFFNLGGRSVDAMLLAGRIGAALGVQVSIAELFDASTVAELDRRMDGLTRAAQDPCRSQKEEEVPT